jgi:hypothetical protein
MEQVHDERGEHQPARRAARSSSQPFPDGMPPMVKITWPPQPTMVDPKRFPDVAAQIAQLFARAHIVLAALKAGGR